MIPRTLLSGALLVALAAPAATQSPDPEAALVLETVEALFEAMATNDAELARALLLPGGRFMAVRAAADGSAVERATSHEAFIASLAAARERWLERYWDAEVRVQGPIATVWTPYDFHRDDAFSHCGVNAFTLVRRPDRWVIAGVTYTVETEDCPPSPLGPPGASGGEK